MTWNRGLEMAGEFPQVLLAPQIANRVLVGEAQIGPGNRYGTCLYRFDSQIDRVRLNGGIEMLT